VIEVVEVIKRIEGRPLPLLDDLDDLDYLG
jgi:hypothetical protein